MSTDCNHPDMYLRSVNYALGTTVECSLCNTEFVPVDSSKVLYGALAEIAARPVVERNPDGDDQAAYAMRLIAREALAKATVWLQRHVP